MKHVAARISFITCLFLLFSARSDAQTVGMGAAPPSADGDRGMADTIYVPPGMEYSASYYCWSDGGGTITANWIQDPPVSWLDGINFPLGQTTSDCADPFVIRYRVHAPLVPGFYEAQFVDQAGIWGGWSVRLKVGDVPGYTDQEINDTLLAGQAYQFPYPTGGLDGVLNIGCTTQPFYPATELVWEYAIHPVAPWITVTPNSLTVEAGTTGTVNFDLFSATPGLFTTYVYNAGTWFGWPYITRVNVLFEQNSGLPAAPVAADGLSLFPVPAQQTLNLAFAPVGAKRITFLDAHGRTVRIFNTSAAKLTVDVEDLPTGVYLVRCTSAEGVSTARFVKE